MSSHVIIVDSLIEYFSLGCIGYIWITTNNPEECRGLSASEIEFNCIFIG